MCIYTDICQRKCIEGKCFKHKYMLQEEICYLFLTPYIYYTHSKIMLMLIICSVQNMHCCLAGELLNQIIHVAEEG